MRLGLYHYTQMMKEDVLISADGHDFPDIIANKANIQTDLEAKEEALARLKFLFDWKE